MTNLNLQAMLAGYHGASTYEYMQQSSVRARPTPELHSHQQTAFVPMPFVGSYQSEAAGNADRQTHTSSPAGPEQILKPAKNRTGRWSLDEKILFLFGLRKFGKGRWKKISIYLPDR